MNPAHEKIGSPTPTKTSAPGRVNLIGEHTDYNGGFVLPMAIPQQTFVELTPREGSAEVKAVSAGFDGGADIQAQYKLGEEKPTGSWIDYLEGTTKILTSEGHRLGGFDVRIHSAVPVGSGLSSSAALEVSFMRALRHSFHLDLTDVQIAQIGQRVENEFVGARVGIMDQMASSLADATHALFLDTRTLEYQQVSLPPGCELVVINSGVAHNHAAGDYNARRSECEQACKLLGVKELRDLTTDDLAKLDKLPPVLKRRARHVITENNRVLLTVEAMRAGDLFQMGALFNESHQSMRDDYQVSVPEVDLLVSIAQTQPEVYGARLTGGGFGGSIVALVKAGAGREVSKKTVQEYQQKSGKTPTILVPDQRA